MTGIPGPRTRPCERDERRRSLVAHPARATGVERFSGADRYEAAAALSRSAGGRTTVQLTTGLAMCDALASGAVAGLNNSHLLLTSVSLASVGYARSVPSWSRTVPWVRATAVPCPTASRPSCALLAGSVASYQGAHPVDPPGHVLLRRSRRVPAADSPRCSAR